MTNACLAASRLRLVCLSDVNNKSSINNATPRNCSMAQCKETQAVQLFLQVCHQN